MTKTNTIETGISSKESIEQYLLQTYGQKRLDQSKLDSIYTHLDVVGYTLDKRGYEIESGLNISGQYGDEYGHRDYYELDEMEDMMWNKWEENDKKEWDDEYVGSEDPS